ncbi:MAG: molybdenum ABC transporter ATP-binding protein [Alphaproteobacteria bacterium]|nr:molybdenum ABC transporter ATP-binding protein [Alphaproteobacteria bacterium]
MSLEVALEHRFGAFALDVAFGIERACVTALFGPSGAGKTSVVNAVAGLFKPRIGRIVVDGRVVLDTEADVFVPARARRTGYVFQDARLFPHMNVEDNLRFGWRRAAHRMDEHAIEGVVDMLGLARLLERRVAKLSGGEKSRVALGRALLSSPDILLLDEPLAALDAGRRAEILPYLERLKETGLPMLYVSHNVDEVARLADEVVMIADGKVTAQGSVFDLLTGLGVAAVGAVLETRIVAQRDGLTVLGFDGGELVVPEVERARRVRLRAEDIMLAREEPRAISANNVLPATVVAVAPHGAQADVLLAMGKARLVARITQASARRLELSPGVPVFAVIKTVIIDP